MLRFVDSCIVHCCVLFCVELHGTHWFISNIHSCVFHWFLCYVVFPSWRCVIESQALHWFVLRFVVSCGAHCTVLSCVDFCGAHWFMRYIILRFGDLCVASFCRRDEPLSIFMNCIHLCAIHWFVRWWMSCIDWCCNSWLCVLRCVAVVTGRDGFQTGMITESECK